MADQGISYKQPNDSQISGSTNYGTTSKMQTMHADIDQVVTIMRNNVEKVLERGDKLEDLDTRAESLESGAQQFQQSSKRLSRKYWWKNAKMIIILVIVIVVVLGIIIGAIVASVKSKE